jgi:L-serine dehydratase
MPKENVPVFEIFGPIMVGPSSSHTAGVARIAFLARKMFAGDPGKAIVQFYGSLSTTWRGHGSDRAVSAGLMGISPEDDRMAGIEKFLEQERGAGRAFPIELVSMPELPAAWHPNTLIITLEPSIPSPGVGRLRVRASSVGGGAIRIDEINGYMVALSGTLHALLVMHHDEVGVIASVTSILAENGVNIAATSSHRKEKGSEALLVIESDGHMDDGVLSKISALPAVYDLIVVPTLE